MAKQKQEQEQEDIPQEVRKGVADDADRLPLDDGNDDEIDTGDDDAV